MNQHDSIDTPWRDAGLRPLPGRHARRILRTALWAIIALIAGAAAAFGQQEPHDKIDPRLKQLASDRRTSARRSLLGDAGSLDIFVIGDPSAIRAIVARHDGIVRSVSGDVVVATVDRGAIGALAASDAVRRIAAGVDATTFNDMAAESVRADEVWTAPPAGQPAYTGRGVIFGLIDSGIDWTHPDFRDPLDTTRSRIATIWDQHDPLGTAPDGFSYGTVWSHEQIEGALRSGDWSSVRHIDSNGHGTHVAGTAAGNGAAIGRYRGIA